HNLAVVAIGAQVIIIYLVAGVAKARGTLWRDGTAIYYPMHAENFSPWPQLNHLLVANDLMVHLISWGSVAIQVLFPLLLLNRWTRRLAVLGLIAMHAGIGVFLGLSVFSLSMVAADVIFVRDSTIDSVGGWLRGRRKRRPGAVLEPAPTGTPEARSAERRDPDGQEPDGQDPDGRSTAPPTTSAAMPADRPAESGPAAS
ncbi:MAG: HTTM domain-containing protein, partial [Actinomycetota bacterium]|nr:HTTM domain-containing protein [Actinomycetota bacterium]